MFCIFIKVTLKPGCKDAYLKVIRQNAAASVENEPGCHRFDVLEDRESESLVYLYEIYASSEALQAHKETAHYRKDRPLINELIAEQEVIRANVLQSVPRVG
ncbi:putative quinol monooxygenase [Microbulbifer celer]|uniref:Quinol monooxygenase n=1 Tax=Microbulbifer celer TaxID=435905 RepID=A0ABW3UDW0_9GAMM|nr:putative quinol monooxygenase [Microbulbifer celer]UFN55929.1 antibiotic biosynthesis monooxygenase [Microbulbifer celer]